jgi:hypothetical protein
MTDDYVSEFLAKLSDDPEGIQVKSEIEGTAHS